MTLVITTYATARYTYALEAQAPLLLAALAYARIDPTDCHWIYTSDGSPEAHAAFQTVTALLPKTLTTHHHPLPNLHESPDGQHLTASNLTIAKLQAHAWHHARLLGATHVWSLESDILPNPNTLRTLLDTLTFDNHHYDVAMAAYPNAAYLGGHGTPQNWILPNVYEDERQLTPELTARLEARTKRTADPTPLTEDEIAAFKQLDTDLEAAPPKGNTFGLNAEGWRPRGWLESAYPGIGQGAIVPTHWVGLGCTLLSARALHLANWTGYQGHGTQDLWLCWRCWHPAGLRLAVVPHSLCSHMKRAKDDTYTTWFARHELGGPSHGHLRVDTVVTTPPAHPAPSSPAPTAPSLA